MADRAVLCGINDYESISDLRGCVNDVENMERLLKETLGFEDSNIRTLTDADVTKEAVTDAFEWLASGVNEGERGVFHFSGHGSYAPSQDDDEETDELICLYGMDWGDPDTYMIDDDLGSLTRRVQQGRLTVVLDCCHSGSGTRAVTANFSMARSLSPKTRLIVLADTANQLETARSEDTLRRLEKGNTALFRSFREERSNPVFARFVEPPSAYRRKPERRKVKRLGVAMRATLNHQLLAGARDDQTAADAFIGGEYNGAFSFYLCDTVRRLGLETYDDVMDATVEKVRSSGYSQVPQNEGPFGSEKVFGGAAGRPKPAPGLDVGPPASEPASLPPSFGGGVPLAASTPSLGTFQDWLRVSEKLLDLVTDQQAIPATAPSAQRAAAEGLVYVHGISRHVPGYSTAWYEALRPHLRRALSRHEVLWSDIVNRRESSTESGATDLELRREIEDELRSRTKRAPSFGRSADESAQFARGERLAIDDFTRYMLFESTRNAILARFDEVVRPLLAAGKTLHIFSHSWGTVVAYEGLRAYDGEGLPGRVNNLFTVGSALSISAVRTNLFGRTGDGRRPEVVQEITNLDAGGDIVGGSIGDHFYVDREYVSLDPFGCSKIPFTNVALNPSCAHGSYFKAGNLEVNRDIFARLANR